MSSMIRRYDNKYWYGSDDGSYVRRIIDNSGRDYDYSPYEDDCGYISDMPLIRISESEKQRELEREYERKQQELKFKLQCILECYEDVKKLNYNTYNLNLVMIDIPSIVAEFNNDNSNTNIAKILFKDKVIASISIELSNKRLKVKISENWIKLLTILEFDTNYNSYSSLVDLQFIIDWVEEGRLAMCEYFL